MRALRHIAVACLLVSAMLSAGHAAVLYVKKTGSDSWAGTSWQAAKKTVKAALGIATSGDQVWVAAGLYVERIKLPAGVKLYGGFPANGGAWESRDGLANETTLDGNLTGVVVTVADGAGRDTVVDGFTVKYGRSDAGGGVYLNNASPTIINNRIRQNSASGYTATGGGICCDNSSPVISGNVIELNTAQSGPAIYCANHSSPVIERNTIAGNTGASDAAIYCADYSQPAISGNIIMGNTGGVYCDWHSAAGVTSNTIVANTSPSFGGGATCISSAPTIANNVVAFNSSGMYCDPTDPVSPVLLNNCVWANTAFDYSGLSAGPGDISLDPAFVNRTSGDYHLTAHSPCINAGGSPALASLVDMDGEARVWAGVVDIGADEFYPTSVALDYARSQPDGNWVGIEGVMVSAAFSGYFYIETDDRLSGMRVNFVGHAVLEGRRVDVAGKIGSASGERFIEAAEVTVR